MENRIEKYRKALSLSQHRLGKSMYIKDEYKQNRNWENYSESQNC